MKANCINLIGCWLFEISVGWLNCFFMSVGYSVAILFEYVTCYKSTLGRNECWFWTLLYAKLNTSFALGLCGDV